MKDYFDPIYYQSTLKGLESIQSRGSSRPVKKSHSIISSASSSANALGRFLKLGKSRSDAHGTSKTTSLCNNNTDDLEDFRLSPSVLNRGPVDRMVHNYRKDLSRSHSWIYGSVKLPSDLPFGYGGGSSPSGSESNSGDVNSANNNNYSCQMMDYYSPCECGGAFLSGNGSKLCKSCAHWAYFGDSNKKSRKRDDGGNAFVNSVRKLTWKSLKQAVKKRPSLDVMKKQGGIVGEYGQQKQIPLEMSNFDAISDANGDVHELHNRMNGFFGYSQHAFSAEDFQTNYFFPAAAERKNVHASCSDIFRNQIPQATASVRMRPKPSRQTWQFNHESAPVPNCHEENSIYHSEWDLRQCIPYDVWVTTTNNVKPRTTMPPPRSKTPNKEQNGRNSSLSKSTSVPYLSEIKKVSSVSNRESRLDVKSKAKSSNSVNSNNFDTVSIRSVASTVKSSSSKTSKTSKENGVVKKSSILAADVNAYQLSKAQSKIVKTLANSPLAQELTNNDDVLSNSSDDLSDNALTAENHMRIAGQKIYMPPNNRQTVNNGKIRDQIVTTMERVPQTSSTKKGRQIQTVGDAWTKEIENSTQSKSNINSKRSSGSIPLDGNVLIPDKGDPKRPLQNIGSTTGTFTSLNNSNNENYRENNGIQSKTNSCIEKSRKTTQAIVITTDNYINQNGTSQIHRDFDAHENYQVEFEEFVFEDNSSFNPNASLSTVYELENEIKSNKLTNNSTFAKNSQGVENSHEGVRDASTSFNQGSNCGIGKANDSGKLGALRRRRSRNGGGNPGKLMREVIYEEELEHDQSPPLHGQCSNIPNQYAVKIVVSHNPPEATTTTTTVNSDYVKPILKNSGRVYAAPINQNNASSITHDKDSNKNASNCASHPTDNDNIYFDSSTLTKKKVQFDQNKVIVCGGDSGPDSDDYGINDECDDRGTKQGKSMVDEGDYVNESSASNATNDCQQNWEESGSASLKSYSARKSALKDNDSKTRNQSQGQKKLSTFEEEVVRKAASFALARQAKVKAEEEKMSRPTVSVQKVVEECFDSKSKVNNLTQNISNQKPASITSNGMKKSCLKITTDSKKSPEKVTSIATPQDFPYSLEVKGNAELTATIIGKAEKHFTKNAKASPLGGVASQIMKAKRIANAAVGKSTLSNCVTQTQEKIVNPNSLLFNDTTRIRLNQSRPSMNEAFKLNLSQNGQPTRKGTSPTGKGVRLKQSSSFKTLGSLPLRPKDPPPPPPPVEQTTKTTSSSPSKLQRSLSSSISSQLDKLLPKSQSANQIYSYGSLNGNRSLSKSEISLPIDLQTTSNQKSRAIKNESITPQQKTAAALTTNNYTNNSSGFKRNCIKTSTECTNPKPNQQPNTDSTNIDANAKKSFTTHQCELSDKMVESKVSNSSPNKTMNVHQNNKTKSILKRTKPVEQQPATNGQENEKQSIEIVTKDDAVSEIRIFSGLTTTITSSTPIPSQTNKIIKNIPDGIHYAASDISPHKKELFLSHSPQPHSNSQESTSSQARPHSTSVILIGDPSTIKANSRKSRSGVENIEEPNSSPYSQPIDIITPGSIDVSPPLVAPKQEELLASGCDVNQSYEKEEESEPLYDDVVQFHHNETTAKSTSQSSSLGRKLISSWCKNVPTIPPNLPPPNVSLKQLPTELDGVKDDVSKAEESGQGMPNDATLDDEVDNLYNDIGCASSQGNTKSLQSFANSMKGAFMNAIKNMDFDKRSVSSSQNNLDKCDSGSINLDNFIYDDTLSLRSSTSEDGSKSFKGTNGSSKFKLFDAPTFKNMRSQFPPPPSTISDSSTIKPLDNVMEQDETFYDEEDNAEPLYDDVISDCTKNGIDANSSDSGAESEDMIPPPLPAHGPPKLPFTDLPLLNFPLLNSRQMGGGLSPEEKVIGIVVPSMKPVGGSTLSKKVESDSVLTKTRSLLNELNDKLSQLNSLAAEASTTSNAAPQKQGSPSTALEFSSYDPNSLQNGTSSSESSGVEEDYNSEKNYSFSNSSNDGASSSAEDNYKLAQVTKLVTETITMARGKFLDSMKLNCPLSSDTSVRRNSGSSPCSDEPIYEEIGGEINRSNSPIYADAFDAKSIFDGASRNEILTFLESIRDRLTTPASDSNSSGSQSSSISSKKGQESVRSYSKGDTLISSQIPLQILSSAENDNAHQHNKIKLRKLCRDCNDVPLEQKKLTKNMQVDENFNHLCSNCNRNRSERKEIITEIHETEIKYGRDLEIISEEFYKPIQIAGLLNKDQLEMVFLNVVELMEISTRLTTMLKNEIHSVTVEHEDKDLNAVNVGKIFLEIGESMMMAFQTYCTRQANAGALLAQLEKEKELLRIFLRVSQMENAVLRRMNLPAFLMVPVQRVTRYPLLLSRLLKVTPIDHCSRDELQAAHEKIEQCLEHMNKATREVASVKLWRRISIINGNNAPTPRRSNELEGASVSIKKMSIDVLDWSSFTDIICAMDDQLGAFYFNGKPLRGIYACLLVRGKNIETLIANLNYKWENNEMFFPPSEDIVKEVKLILVRVKNTRFCLLREPLCLSKCVVSQGENEFQDYVEINEITSKNTYHLQGTDKQATSTWLKHLQCYSLCVGQWRKRRDGLANIMMNGMLKHL